MSPEPGPRCRSRTGLVPGAVGPAAPHERWWPDRIRHRLSCGDCERARPSRPTDMTCPSCGTVNAARPEVLRRVRHAPRPFLPELRIGQRARARSSAANAGPASPMARPGGCSGATGTPGTAAREPRRLTATASPGDAASRRRDGRPARPLIPGRPRSAASSASSSPTSSGSRRSPRNATPRTSATS